jgi:hypothetical protein
VETSTFGRFSSAKNGMFMGTAQDFQAFAFDNGEGELKGMVRSTYRDVAPTPLMAMSTLGRLEGTIGVDILSPPSLQLTLWQKSTGVNFHGSTCSRHSCRRVSLAFYSYHLSFVVDFQFLFFQCPHVTMVHFTGFEAVVVIEVFDLIVSVIASILRYANI